MEVFRTTVVVLVLPGTGTLFGNEVMQVRGVEIGTLDTGIGLAKITGADDPGAFALLELIRALACSEVRKMGSGLMGIPVISVLGI